MRTRQQERAAKRRAKKERHYSDGVRAAQRRARVKPARGENYNDGRPLGAQEAARRLARMQR